MVTDLGTTLERDRISVSMPIAKRVREWLRTCGFLWRARHNYIHIWGNSSYEREFWRERLLFRSVFIANSPETVNHVLVSHAENYPKSAYTDRALEPLVGNGLFISKGELWRRQRRLAAPAFRPSRLKEYSTQMIDASHDMLARWESAGEGAELEVCQEMARLTADVVCRTMFSQDLDEEQARVVFEAFTQYQESLGVLDVVEILGLPSWLPRPAVRKGRKAVKHLDSVINAIVAKRRADRSAREDLLELLFEYRDPDTGEDMDNKLLRDEVAVMFLAGHETAGNALSWCWYLLSQHPNEEARLHREIDQVLNGRSPVYSDLKRLVYTRAILEETMRLYPPLHLFSRQAVADDMINGQLVPAGSMVIVSPWLLHRHRLIWDEPAVFRPERFLAADAKRGPKHCYVPFGTGPRACPGGSFGMIEATLVIASVAQRFRLRLKPNHRVEPVARLTTRPSHGLPMSLHHRDD